jgi:RHS repeat-associated protein
MNINSRLATAILIMPLSAAGQFREVGSPASSIVERGPHHSVHQRTISRISPEGRTYLVTNSFVELASGLNFWNGDQGRWEPSREIIEVFQDAAVARQGAHKVVWAANLNSPGAVDLETSDGKRFRSHLLGIVFTDARSGRSILIAEPKDSIGEVVGNQVIYRDAFLGPFRADVRYTYTVAGIAQDILIREALPSPREYDATLNSAEVRLEIWTEFLASAEPVKSVSILKSQNDRVARQDMVDPDFSDETLEFGAMRIGQGTAFSLEPESEGSFREPVPVGKNWVRIVDGNGFRQVLVEKTDYLDIKAELEALPQAAALNKPAKEALQAKAKRAAGRQQLLASLGGPVRKEAKNSKEKMRVAAMIPPEKGFVLDYSMVATATNFTFKRDTTYFVSANITLSGTTILESAVIKYTNGNTAPGLVIAGPLICRTDSYNPAVFTGKDDDTIGDRISASTGSPTRGTYKYYFDISGNTNVIELSDVQMRWGTRGININSVSSLILRNAQFRDHSAAIVGAGQARLRNVLIHNGTFAFGSGGNYIGEHVTLHKLANLRSANFVNLTFLTNSLVISLTNFVNYVGANVVSNINDAGIFQTVGAGAHYLANDSTNRNAGTTNINPDLLASLPKRTTYPPVVLTNHITGDTTLTAQAQRDTDTPDLGYHYDPLDFVASQIAVTNATLTLEAGTALGLYGASNAPGIVLLDGGRLISEGTPDNLNRIVRYNLVQEDFTGSGWSANSVGPSITTPGTYATNLLPTEARFRFTDWSMPANGNDHFYAGATNLTLSFQDCQFRGGKLTAVQPDVNVVNSLFDRVSVTLAANANPFTALVRNCTFFGGNVTVQNNAGGVWSFTDNLFDTTNIVHVGVISHNFNAYLTNSARLTNHGANDVLLTVTGITYDVGALGRFYLPTNLTDHSPLFDSGSQNATNAGLYHYATTTTYVKEATSTVDIGFHYVASNEDGEPIDSDFGFPDYLEDVNGNGLTDAGETCFHDPILTIASSMNYIKGSPPKLLDTNALVFDSISMDFGDGRLTITVVTNADPQERIAIRNQGSGADQIGLSGTNVTFAGTTIGNFSGGTGTNSLFVNFNTNASLAAVQALARNVTFHIASNNPAEVPHTLQFELTDGDGGTNAAVYQIVNVVCPTGIDVMLVIDVSQSLSAPNFLLAKQAASDFVSHLDVSKDKVGLISFAHTATQEFALTNDFSAVQAAILGLSTRTGTLIHPPLNLARTNLSQTASNVLPLLVLLSDGVINNTPLVNTNEAKYAANTNKEAGIRIISVAYGTSNQGTNLMKELASSPLDFYFAPTASEIDSNYTALAQGICRGNTAPTVTLHTPTNGMFFPGLSVQIVASASDADGSVTNLSVFHGTTNIASATGTNLTATWHPPNGGNYSLHAKATDNAGAITSSSAATISVNGGPTVNAGADLELMLIGTNSVFTNLSGTVTDADNLPNGRVLSIAWSGVSGAGPIFLAKDPADPNEPRKAKVTFNKPGIYSLRLTASDSLLSASDDLTITVNKTNVAPQVYAGPNQTVTFPDPVYLPGAVTDDGAPVGGALTVQWTGPTGVQYANDAVTNAFARFNAPGVYQLSLSASDGAVTNGGLSTTQSVTITVELPKEQSLYRNADVVSGGVGGMRGAIGDYLNPRPGSGVIQITGLVANVKQAFLYWSGPVDSQSPTANASVVVNGRLVEGINTGIGHSDSWDYQEGVHAFPKAHSYRADITALVRSHGNGTYALTNLVKGKEVEVNGASIIVIQEDPDSQNPHDLILWSGNDSNDSIEFYPMMNDSSYAIYSIASSDSRVFLGGNFGSGNITNRNHFAVLGQGGGLDFGFVPTSGVTADNSAVYSALPLSDGSVLISGEFTQVEGQTRKRIARYESNGVLATNFNLDINGTVLCLAKDPNGRILIAGSFTTIDGQNASKVARLLANGQLDTNFTSPSISASVLAVASDRDTNILIGGDFQTVGGSNRRGLARLNGSGVLQGSSDPDIQDRVRTIFASDSGKVFIGGDFTSVQGSSKDGIASLNEDLTLDTAFTNSVAGTLTITNGWNVYSVGVASVYSITQLDTNRIVIGGRFAKVNGVAQQRVAIVNQSNGSLAASQPSVVPDLFTRVINFNEYDATAVHSTALQADGKILVAGNFRTINGGLPANGAFRLLADGSLDTSFRVVDSGALIAFPDVFHVSGDDVSIQLHVSDGQPMTLGVACRADPPISLNGMLWMTNVVYATCGGGYDDWQIFAGESVPSGSWACSLGMGLWDVTNRVVPSSLLSAGPQTLLLTTPLEVDCTKPDLVTYVAAVVRMPANTNATQDAVVKPPVELPPIAWADRFNISRGVGRQVLNVLSNDVCPNAGMLTISSVTAPGHGTCEIFYEGSAILYIAAPGFFGEDQFSYTIVDSNGNAGSSAATVNVEGDSDAVMTSLGKSEAGNLGLSGYQTLIRGGSRNADYYRFTAAKDDLVDIVVSNAAFAAHVYLLNSRGELIGSGTHSEGSGLPTLAEIEGLPIMETGTYFLEVTSHDPGESGTYGLHLSAVTANRPPELEINGVRLNEDTPYFLGTIENDQSITNLFTLRNTGRFQLYYVEAEISQANATTTVTPYNIGLLPANRGIPLVTTITANPSGSGLAEETITISDDWSGARDYHVQFHVNPSGVSLPPISISSPVDGAVFRAPDMLPVTAEITANGGNTINKVEFYADDARQRRKIGEAAGSPYTVNWQQPEPGIYRLFAAASISTSEDDNLLAQSPPITVTIASRNFNSAPRAASDAGMVTLNSRTNVLNVLANDTDADGDTLRIITLLGTTLGNVSISADGKAIFYTPPADTFGEEDFGYTVDDGHNGRSTAAVLVKIVAATATIAQPTPADTLLVNSNMAVHIDASTSQGAILNVEVLANGVKVGTVATNPFVVNWTPTTSGFYTLKAVAHDSSGNRVESAEVTVGVGSPGQSPPFARFSNLHEGDRLRDGVFNLIGTADSTNASETVSYQLKLFRPTTNGVIEIADFTPSPVDGSFHFGRVTGGLLAPLDLTGIRNGVYLLALAVRSDGKESVTQVSFVLESNAKLGQFTFSEEDLVVPLGGIPITVIRTYDSLKTDLGDFGHSWTYSINDLEIEIDEERGIIEDEDEEPFSMRLGGGRNITLTLPGGQRTTFLYSLNPGASDDGVPCFCYEAKWEAAPGVYAQLGPLDNNRLQFIPWQNVIPPYWLDAEDTPFDSYDFSGFVLTNADGTEYVLKGDDLGDHPLPPDGSQLRGVRAYSAPKLNLIRTRNGDEITVTNFMQSGTNYLRITQYNPQQQPQIATNSILLVRNSSGLIESAYGPESLDTDGSLKSGAIASVRYAYSNSFLVAVERLVKSSPLTYETNRYEYTNATHPHFITGIIDARGVRVAATGKDALGRLTSLRGPGQAQGVRFIHDAANQREIAIDPHGYQTVHEFDRRGNVVRTIDALGQVTHRDYDDTGNQLSETDALGHTQRYGYDALGNRISTIDALGHTNLAFFGSRGQLLASVDALGRGVTNVYDAADNLVYTTNTLGHVTQYLYNSRGLLTASFDVLGTLTTNRYDANGRLTNTATLSAQSSILSSNAYAYDERGNRTNETTWMTINGSLQTVTTSHEFDARNRLVRSLDALGYTNTTTFNALGKAESTTDRMGRQTRYWHDARGNLIQTAYPSDANTPAAVTRTVYDELNRPVYTQRRTAANDPADSGDTTANATHTIYDPLGRVERTESLTNVVIGWTEVADAPATVLAGAGGLVGDTAAEFDEAGRVLSQIDARGVTTFFEYDAGGRRTASTVYDDESRGLDTRSLYDAAGNVVVTLDALGRGTTNVFDALHRSVEVQLADGTKRFTIYDELGRRVAEVDQAGVTNRFGYDALGRLTAATNAWATANATWATYRYDEQGNQTNQVDALGRVTRFAFDKLGRRIGRTLPGGQSEGVAYNAAGSATWHTNFNGQAIRMDYDAASRILAKVYSDGTSNTFAYTLTGQRWKMSDASGVTSNRFDGLDRLIERTHEPVVGWGPMVWQNYAYDPQGNLVSVAIRDYYNNIGSELTYDHDSLNRLSAVNDLRLGFGVPKTTSYEYDGLGNLASCEYPTTVKHAWRYNSLNRLTNLLVVAGSVALGQFDYALGVTGQRTSLIEHVNGVWRTNLWNYDQQYRLTNELLRADSGTVTGQVAYAYDAVANRTNRLSTLSPLVSTNSSYNTNDWLGTDVYDSAGNTRTNAAEMVYRYNADNQLTNVVHGTTNTALTYDADGNRISKTVSVSGTVTTRTYYVVDNRNPTGYAQVLEEWAIASNYIPTSKRIYHYGLDLISQRVDSGDPNFFGYDGHGSVRLLTDTGTNVTDTYTYDANGSLIASSGTTLNHYRYAGEQLDEDLGQYYLRARYFNPETGRFLTMDSFEGKNEDPLSLHKYLYCHGDPANRNDPSGHQDANSTAGAGALAFTIDTFYYASVITWRLSGPVVKVLNTFYPYIIAGAAALTAVDTGTQALLKNTEPVPAGNFSYGRFVEEKYGVNLGGNYPKIDDWRPESGVATSVRAHRLASPESYLDAIQRDAQKIGNIEKEALRGYTSIANGSKLVVIQPGDITAKALVVAVPQNDIGFFQRSEVRQALQRISETSRTIIRIVPVRGWKR